MTHCILLGGGHGHILILKSLAKRPVEGVRVTLITDNPKQYYSGMLAGFIEGIYTEEEISFDVPALAARAGVDYREERICAVDHKNRQVVTEEDRYDYDLLSMNLGVRSREIFSDVPEEASYVKPIARVVAFKEMLDGEDTAGKTLLIVGGGASGMELAFAFREIHPEMAITVVTDGAVVSRFNQRTQKTVRRLAREKKIQLVENRRIDAVDDDAAYGGSEAFAYDFLILSTGFSPVDVDFKGFETDQAGFLLAGDDLHVGEDALAMGDMITLHCYPKLNKAGVFAIRQAPVLEQNLRSLLTGEGSERDYRPQTRYLQILNTGGKKAILNWGPFSLYSHLSWRIKDWIDRRYME